MLVRGKALFLHSRMKTFSSEYVSLSGFGIKISLSYLRIFLLFCALEDLI